MLACRLFRMLNGRTLLLSATPYKMMTLNDEVDDDHYSEFVKTLGFLVDEDGARVQQIQDDLHDLRLAIHGRSQGSRLEAKAVCDRLQDRYSKSRRARKGFAQLASKDAMVKDCEILCKIESQDLEQALLGRAGSAITGSWRRSRILEVEPYFLNFMLRLSP